MATLRNDQNDVIIYGTDFNDDLFNENVNVKIFGYEGNDTIENRGYDVIVDGGAGDDNIYSDVYPRYGSENYRRATIYGGTGNDTIRVNDNETSLNAGAGDDYISVFSGSNSWENNTLQGGQGNDTIYGGKSNVIIYEEGDGNDTIFCGTSTDTIQIASNKGYTSVRNGNDVIITVGNGSLLLKNPAGIKITTAPKNMNGTTNNDEIFNTSSYRTILADAGADIIYNIDGRGSKLDGGTGNDFIYNGNSVENLYNESKKTLDKIKAVATSSGEARNQMLEEAKKYYNSVKYNIMTFSNDLADQIDSIFKSLDDFKTGLTGSSTIVSKINDAINLGNEVIELHRVTTTTDVVAYTNDLLRYQHHLEYINDPNSSLTDSQRQHFREVIDRNLNPNNPNNSSRYEHNESLRDKVVQARSSSKSFWQKTKDVKDVLTEAENNANAAHHLALNRTNALATAGWALSILDFSINTFQIRDTNAWKEAEGSNILEKVHNFRTTFREKDSEQYDKLNLNAIDMGMAALEGTAVGFGTAALATAGVVGAPLVLAGVGIVGVFYCGTALLKTAYSSFKHSDDIDFGATFLKNLNPFSSGSTYVSKRVMESYSLSGSSIDISIEIITVIGGKGNDTLLNDRCDNVVIDAGDADDMIINQESEKVSISAGNGNDSITNINSSNVTIFGNTGNDLINNNSDSVTINAGDGNNSVVNYMGSSISVDAGSGDDYIDNIGNYATVDAGNGNNIVSNIGAHASLKTGKDNDEVSLIGAAGIINAGAGNDYVYSHGDKNTIDTGDGNDSVENFEGSELVISTDNGKDYIESFGDSNTINSGNDDDVVNHIGNSSSINSDSGDDYVEIFGDFNTAIGGSGSDYILVVGDKNSVSSGTDNDILEIFGDKNTINLGKGNDFVAIDGSKNIIEYVDGDGNDVIEGLDSQSTLKISGNGYSTIKSGNDVIVKVGNGSISLIGTASFPVNIVGTLLGGNTDEIGKNIENRTSNTLISGTNGNDSIYNCANFVTINTGNGDNTVYNAYAHVIIFGGMDNDSIRIWAGAVTINSGAGDDTIINYNSGYATSSINAEDGNDYIYSDGYGDYVTINSGNGSDTIHMEHDFSKLYSGNSNDYVTILGTENFIDCGEGNDSIYYGFGYRNTIIGGKGNDIISLASDNNHITIKYESGDGNDIIYGIKSNSTLQIGGAKYTTTKSGTDLIVGVGSEKITVVGGVNVAFMIETIESSIGTSNVISLTSGNDSYVNNKSNAIIDALAGNDSIINSVESVAIYGGSGNDTIYSDIAGSLESGEKVTIDGGTGADYISNDSPYSKLEGQEGNDTIVNYGWNTSIYGGSGKDVISNFNAFEWEGNNVLISGGTGEDSITSTAKNDSIYGDEGNDTIWAWNSNILVDGGADNDYIYAGNYETNTSIYGGAGDDTIVNFNSESYIGGGKGNDLIYNDNQLNNIFLYDSGDGTDTIYGYNANDTIKITGEKYSTVKSGNDLKISVSTGSILLKDIANTTINISGTLKGGNSDAETLPTGITIRNSVLTASNKFTRNTINLNNEWSNSVTKVNASAISNDLSIVGNTTNNSIKGGKSEDTINGGDGKDTLFGGNGNDKLYGDADNDVLKGDAGNDSLNGGTGNDTLTGGAGNDVFIYEGGNDVITDYKSGEDKIKLDPRSITNSTVKGSDVILTTSNGTLNVKSTKDKVIDFIDNNGKITNKIFFDDTSYAPLANGLSYDAKRIVLKTSNKFTGNTINLGNYLSTVKKVNASANSQSINIVGNSSDNSIKGGKNADTINGGAGKDTILGGTGNDKIYGGTGNDILQGDAGNDTLYGGSGNDTLTGSAGNDIFVYESGNDVIKDYKTNEDKINLNLSAITSSSVKGSDVILTTSNGTLTVKGTKDKIITFVDNNGKTSERIFFANTSYAPLETGLSYDAKRVVLTASNKFTGNKIDLGEYLGTVTKLNSSATSQNINIVGNVSDNSIKAGKGADIINGGNGKDTIFGGADNDSLYGGNDNDILNGEAGNDTLNGGRGNDTLTGGAGNDVFIYEGGNDVITDYTAGQDSIKVSGTISNVSYNGKNVVFSIGNGSLTVNNAKGKDITVTNNNNQTQTYSKTLDLIYDNNFVADEFALDDISEVTETNYSVGKLEYSSNNNELANNSIVSASYFDEK